MASPKLEPVVLTDGERQVLEGWARRRKTAQALALRSRIVLACGAGETVSDVAASLGSSGTTVSKWRSRFVAGGLDGLSDDSRPGRPRTVTDERVEKVITATLEQEPPAGNTHWSTRSMARSAGMSQSAVSRIWRASGAAPTWKKSSGFHPMTAFADHGASGNGEPLAIVLRAGSAGSNTAADHIEATRLSLAQLRWRVLVRTDSGGGTHGFLDWLTAPSRRLRYSAGMTITGDMQDAILTVPVGSWTPAYDADGQVRDGAWVVGITGMPDLSSWSPGMRVIVRKERPRPPGRSCGFTGIDGHRFTAFATDAKEGQLADLELRHRRRARCEDRIRCAKDTGLRNLPLGGFTQNQLWCEIVALACGLLAWSQLLALAGQARR